MLFWAAAGGVLLVREGLAAHGPESLSESCQQLQAD